MLFIHLGKLCKAGNWWYNFEITIHLYSKILRWEGARKWWDNWNCIFSEMMRKSFLIVCSLTLCFFPSLYERSPLRRWIDAVWCNGKFSINRACSAIASVWAFIRKPTATCAWPWSERAFMLRYWFTLCLLLFLYEKCNIIKMYPKVSSFLN